MSSRLALKGIHSRQFRVHSSSSGNACGRILERNQPNPTLTYSWILRKGRKSSWSKQHLNLRQACLVYFIAYFSSPFKLLSHRDHMNTMQCCIMFGCL
uniref:Uncharacterized protein n=1 Tax=Arundo donax TaxID=35708 RepID=A0A0A9E7X9_ARUDO